MLIDLLPQYYMIPVLPIRMGKYLRYLHTQSSLCMPTRYTIARMYPPNAKPRAHMGNTSHLSAVCVHICFSFFPFPMLLLYTCVVVGISLQPSQASCLPTCSPVAPMTSGGELVRVTDPRNGLRDAARLVLWYCIVGITMLVMLVVWEKANPAPSSHVCRYHVAITNGAYDVVS
ncbi:hypothetical protein F5X96DRAFT_620868, partial [Biscogniauxia mediterranea]